MTFSVLSITKEGTGNWIYFTSGRCRHYDLAAVECSHTAADLVMDVAEMKESITIWSQSLDTLMCAYEEQCLASDATDQLYNRFRRLNCFIEGRGLSNHEFFIFVRIKNDSFSRIHEFFNFTHSRIERKKPIPACTNLPIHFRERALFMKSGSFFREKSLIPEFLEFSELPIHPPYIIIELNIEISSTI